MFYYLFIIIFYLLFAYLCAKNIRWGIYTVVALLPTYLIRYTVFGIPGTLLEGMIWILFIVWLIKLKQEKNLSFNPLVWIKNIFNHQSSIINHNPVPDKLKLPLILFLIASTFATFISTNQLAAAGIWKAYFIEPLLFFIVFIYTIKNPVHFKKAVRFLGLTVLAIGVFAVIQKLTGVLISNPFWADEATRRITTFFGYPNANALFVAPVLLLLIGNLISDYSSWFMVHKNNSLSINHKLWWIIYYIICIILGTLTIIFAKSTGGLIGLVAGLIFFLIFYKKTRLFTLLAILIISAGLNFSTGIKNKITDTFATTSQTHLPLDASDIHMRSQQWREASQMLMDTPVFGAGLAGYQNLMVPYHQNPHVEIYLYPHNFFLNFWTETGLLGLVSIIWILFVFFWLGHRSWFMNNKNNPKPINHNQILTLTTSMAMITLLVHGLVDVPYFKNDLSFLFWIIIGLMIVIYNQSRINTNGSPITHK